jgi:SpoVK/Ycf46/Vps4 family AAA+-type ATPase
VLLFGPPGCGKTLLARATAGECGLPFSNVRIEEILDPYFGVSESKLHDAFVQARRFSRCVLFIDELDAIAFARREHSGSVGRPLVDQLLQEPTWGSTMRSSAGRSERSRLSTSKRRSLGFHRRRTNGWRPPGITSSSPIRVAATTMLPPFGSPPKRARRRVRPARARRRSARSARRNARAIPAPPARPPPARNRRRRSPSPPPAIRSV